MQLIIRKAAIDDATVIADIHCRSWKAAYTGLIPSCFIAKKNAGRLAMWEANLEKNHLNYIAVIEEKPVGFFSLLSPCRDADVKGGGEIGAVYLVPQFQGYGIGKQLLDAAVNKLRELGHCTIILWVLEKNDRARRFYEKHGFYPDGSAKELSPGLGVLALRYRIQQG